MLVAAAGNGGGPAIGSPAGYMGVVAVGGTDQNGTWRPVRELRRPRDGSVSVSPGVAVAAPASTGPDNTPGMVSATLVKNGSYTTTYGTSNSTAIVSGIVALIRAKFPTMNAANVINRLIKTATHPAGTPYSEYLGFGIPDAYAALTADIPTVCESPLGSLAADGTVASPGIWPSIVNKTTYTPTCDGGSATSSSADTPTADTSSDQALTVPKQSFWSSHTGLIGAGLSTIVLLIIIAVLVIYRRRNRPVLIAQATYYPPPGYPNGPPLPPQPPPVQGMDS